MILARMAAPTALFPAPQLGILPRARTIRFATTLSMPIQLQASIAISNHESPSGARGILGGAVVLSGLSTVLSFSCGAGMRRRGEPSVVREVTLIPAGDWFVIRSTHFQAPIALRSPLQIQFRDSERTPLSEVLSLGRIGEQPLNLCASFRVPATVAVEIATDDRSFGSGSQVTIDGKVVFPHGILAHCTFRLADIRSEGGQHLAGNVDAITVRDGQEIQFAKRFALSPAPARPLHSIAFLDGHGYRFAANGAPGSQHLPTHPPTRRSIDLGLYDLRRVCFKNHH